MPQRLLDLLNDLGPPPIHVPDTVVRPANDRLRAARALPCDQVEFLALWLVQVY